MGIMVSEVYEALLEAGASKQGAKAAAESIPVVEQLATKQDIARLTTKVARLEWAIVSVLALLLKLVFFPASS